MRRQVFAAIVAIAHARDLDFLLSERARCESIAAGDDEGELCTPVQYVELLVELGDAHLETEERTEATEAYELAAMDSFESLGKDSREHSTALLRLASAHLHSGEYRKAHGLLSGWLRTDRSGWNYLGTDAQQLAAEFDELDALAKQVQLLRSAACTACTACTHTHRTRTAYALCTMHALHMHAG